MVVFWKEDSGRQLRLTLHPRTKEEKKPALHHHQNLLPLTTLMFLLILLTHLRCLLDLLDRQIRLDYNQGCSQLLHLLVGEEEQELNMYLVSDHDRDPNHRNLN